MKGIKGEDGVGSLKKVFYFGFLYFSFVFLNYSTLLNLLASGCKIISFSCVFLFAGLFWHIINSII